MLRLPYPVAMVQWEDALKSSGPFTSDSYEPWLRQTVGFLTVDAEDGIVVVFTVDETNEDDSDRLDTWVSIPRGMVRQIVVLVPADEERGEA